MYCPNCGTELPDDSVFCGVCGTRILKPDAVPTGGPTEGEEEPVGTGAQSGEQAPEEGTGAGAKDKGGKRKAGLSPKLIGIVAAIAAVAVIVIIAVSLLSSGGGSNAYVYLSGGQYMLLNELEEGEEISIASSKNSDESSGLVRFDPDGTYVYYYSKYDTSTGTGTLNRAQFGKLKQNSGKNENYIETIATNVNIGFSMQDDGTIVYCTGGDDLYYYDGKETVQIAKDVDWFYSDGESRLIYSVEDDGDAFLYGVQLSDTSSSVKLASGYDDLSVYVDLDQILYTKYSDDGDAVYYVTGMDGESEKLGSGISLLSYSSDEGIYYLADSGSVLLAYDYVIDNYAEDDEGLTEPDLENYTVPKYKYTKLDSESDTSAYVGIYTSCTVAASFYSTWYSYRSLEYAAQNSSDHAADYQAFVDKYIDLEDEDGYFEVTEEIKSDLIALAQTCGEGYDNEWLELCFGKEQDGTTYDYDSYDADCETYYEAEDRINLRAELQDEENGYALSSLYCLEDGTQTLIAENIVAFSRVGDGLLYNTVDMITDQVDMETISGAYEVEDELFVLDDAGNNYLLIYGDAVPYQLTANAASVYAQEKESDSVYFRAGDSSLYLFADSGNMYQATISSGSVSALSLVTDDAEYLAIVDDTVYYFSEVYEDSSGYSFGNLNTYDGKSSTRLAQDIMEDYFRCYEDGQILAYTDLTVRNSTYRGEMILIDAKGNVSPIADGVERFVRVDGSTILYISYGDLYVYDGKSSELVAEDVDYFWCLESEDIEIGRWSNYYY